MLSVYLCRVLELPEVLLLQCRLISYLNEEGTPILQVNTGLSVVVGLQTLGFGVQEGR